MSDHEQDRMTEDMQDEQQWLRTLLLRDSERFQLPDSLKSENLLHKLETLEAPADEDTKVLEIKPKKRSKTIYFRYLSYAACLAIVVFGWFNARQSNTMSAAPQDFASKAAPAEIDDATMSGPAMMAAESSMVEPEVEQPVAESYSQVYDALTTIWDNSYAGSYDYGIANDGNGERIMLETPVADAAPKADIGGGNGVYQTNVQVEGVDESDIVKTDGTYIYQYRFDPTTGGAQIAISTANGLKLLSTILLPEYADAELYLSGDRLVVVQSVPAKEAETLVDPIEETLSSYLDDSAAADNQNAATRDSENVVVPDYYRDRPVRRARYVAMTEALTFDISNHKMPKEISHYHQDGSYVSSRLSNDTLYLVTNKTVNGDIWTASDPIYEYLPIVGKDEKVGVLPAGDIVIPPYLENLNYAVVTALNISTQDADTKAVLGMADQIMMSQNNLYLTANVMAADSRNWRDRFTGITRFSVTNGGLKYLASGKVAGYIDNQFSLDEYGGNLRIATTSYNDDDETVNNLYVLDGLLRPVGSVEDLAEGERIYSVRYVGETAYVVTFRETDPLFVIDLKDPAKPVVKGQLKLPGFSEYLHPIDQNTLLGLGVNTVVTQHGGVFQDGLKLSLFDVSDPTNPKEKASFLLGNAGSTTEALQNHKAIMYYPEQRLIGFPATIYTVQGASANNPWSGSQQVSFAGYLVVRIEADGFEIIGTLPNEDSSSSTGFMRYNSSNTISRGIYIGKTLYTISPARIMAYSLDNFERIGELKY
ncbi:beta-propeller domain-containing protein [Oscillospiraceae bacterium LTW-04]|nr:beta-propeller domain-containing protein [Oscillospiraceae bacterium MB24-C1]